VRLAQTWATPLWPDSRSLQQGGNLYKLDYGYLDNGWVSWRERAQPSVTHPRQTFNYDRMGQLHRVVDTYTGSDIEKFEYDDAGNLTQSVDGLGTSWSYNAAGTPSSHYTTAAYAGNQVPERASGGGVEHYLYDGAGRIAEIFRGGVTETYAYDGLGRLRRKTIGGSVALELRRDAMQNIIWSNDGSKLTYRFAGAVYDPAGGFESDQILPILGVKAGAHQWQLEEPTGGVWITLNDAGAPQSRRELGAYGDELFSSGSSWTPKSFHGMFEEDGNGLIAAGPRHLMAENGTWLQPEPLLSSGQGLNLRNPRTFAAYRYGANNPTGFADRTGYQPGEEEEPADEQCLDADAPKTGTENLFDAALKEGKHLVNAGDGIFNGDLGPATDLATSWGKNVVETAKELASPDNEDRIPSHEQLIVGAQTPDKGGLTKAGRALQKHGDGCRSHSPSRICPPQAAFLTAL